MTESEICRRIGQLLCDRDAYIGAISYCIDHGLCGGYPSHELWRELTYRVINSNSIFNNNNNNNMKEGNK